MHPKRQGEPLDPKDPHDRERQRLNELLPRFPELSPREQRRAEEDLALWEFREKQKHPNMTLVIGDDGMGPSDWYQEHHKQKEQERYLDGMMRVGDAIANNPFAGGVALDVLERTGDPDQASNASVSLLALTGGGGRGRGNMQAMTPKRPLRPSYRKGFNRGTASFKPPPGRATASPPKLTPSQKRLQDHARRYRESLPKERGDKYVTVAIAVVEQNGVRETWVVTNTKYMPKEIANAKMPSHILMPGTKGPAGNKDRPPADRVSYHHAEHQAVHLAWSNGYKVIELYPSRPACADCSGFRAMGITVIDP